MTIRRKVITLYRVPARTNAPPKRICRIQGQPQTVAGASVAAVLGPGRRTRQRFIVGFFALQSSPLHRGRELRFSCALGLGETFSENIASRARGWIGGIGRLVDHTPDLLRQVQHLAGLAAEGDHRSARNQLAAKQARHLTSRRDRLSSRSLCKPNAIVLGRNCGDSTAGCAHQIKGR
jgi:hypothetical protein